MDANTPIVKHLQRLHFCLLHLGLLIIAAGIAVMLFIDASSWPGYGSIFKALFHTYSPAARELMGDSGVTAGWAMLLLAGALNLSIKLFLLKPRRRTLEKLGDAEAILVPAMILIVSWLLGKHPAAVQVVGIIGYAAMISVYGFYLRFSNERVKAASDFTVSIALVLVIFLSVNIYMHRHTAIIDTSSARYYTLSETTHKQLDRLTKNVKIYAIIWATETRKGLILDYTRKLFEQITNYSERVTVEYLAPRSAKANQIMNRYNLINNYEEALIFECGERSKTIPIQSLTGAPLAVLEEPDVAHPSMNDAVPEIKAYKGENIFYLALNEVTTDRKKEIIFLEGHGERPITEYSVRGLTRLDEELTKLNYLVHTMTLRQGEVPVADALVVAAPQNKYQEWEIELLRRYLEESNGSLIYLAEPVLGEKSIKESGLAELLTDYGIEVQNDLVMVLHNYRIVGEFATNLYALHPITKTFKNEVMEVSTARSVRAGAAKRATMEAMELISVLSNKTVQVWGEVNYGTAVKSAAEDELDHKAPLPFMVISGPREVEGKTFETPRIAVFGDADIASNQYLERGNNKRVLLNTFNWALGKDAVEIVPPKDYEFIEVDVSDELMASMMQMVVISLPGFIVLFGILVLVRRRT